MLFSRALPADFASDHWIARCVADFRTVYERQWNVQTKPYGGIHELLAALADAGVPCAVLSNKPHDFTKKCVTSYFPEVAFQAVFGQRPNVARKPDPAGAVEIAACLAIPPQQFLFLGDSAVDIQTAIAADMRPVGALWGFRSRSELEQAGATELVQHPRELLTILRMR